MHRRIAFIALAAAIAAGAASVQSPGGRLAIAFETLRNGQVVYTVSYQGKPLVEASALRLNPHRWQMQEAFELYEKWGVAELKIDFAGR